LIEKESKRAREQQRERKRGREKERKREREKERTPLPCDTTNFISDKWFSTSNNSAAYSSQID